MKVLNLLQMFEKAAGQKINRSESSIFFSTNIIRSNRQHVCQMLQIVEADDKYTYLGLPNMMERSKSSTLGFLKNNVKRRVQS